MGRADTGALQSMTGFARSQGEGHGSRWVWELRSVNGKGLDVRFRVPPGLEQLEQPAREMVTARFARGNVQLALTLQRDESLARVQINRPVLDQLVAIADELRGKVNGAPPAIEHLLSIRGVVDVVDGEGEMSDDLRRDILASLETAIEALAAMRRQEGAVIRGLLSQRLDRIADLTDAARTNPARSSDAIRAKLAEQVAALIGAVPSLDADRLNQEAVLLATRADIGEEIDRLDAHVAAARELLAAGGAVGRRLDFLAQEFNREANTLCSKSNDSSITATGLDLKATVDQFREQVQNLE